MRHAGGCFVLTRGGPWGGLGSCRRLPATIGDERFTSQGSQQPPGSPLSREEGEAPPHAPTPEGPRRSRRVRLRGSCRHRPGFLGRRELATSAPARRSPTFSEVSEVGNNGARGSEGQGEQELPSRGRPVDSVDSGAEGPSGPRRARRADGHRQRTCGSVLGGEGDKPSRVLERPWSLRDGGDQH